ncbi:hypothetical protein C1645_739371 [Glomus cerebriforme]|uniref:Uncharacterized protein n=1 Tax=Glomus cerebriforme TaxID=658196 RepID=A0A397SXB4_9GLOM|nr:hypothetical protein C1645_739371 [Glomus cerebriforme]
MSPNKHNQTRRQQPHRSVKESNVNTVLGSSSHQRAKSPIPKSLTPSQLNETTSLDKDREIITQTYGTSSDPASARRTNHCAIAPYDYVKGNAPRSKVHNLTKIFAKFSTYMGAAVRIIKKLNKGKYMCIFFLDEQDLLDAIKILITKSRMKAQTVCVSLSHFGDIESIKLVTRGLFQHAFIVYTSALSAQTFVTYWGTYILRDAHRKAKSYADAAKSHKDIKSRGTQSKGNKSQNHQNQQPRTSSSAHTLNNGTQQGGSIHGAQSERFTAMYNEVLKTMKQINTRLSNIDNKIFHLEKCATKQPTSLSPHARELAAKNSPQHNEQVNLQEINALKKESSETRSLTNSCVNILKQMQSFMEMDTPADDDEVIDKYDRDGDDDEDEHMDAEEYDEEGFLKEPTEDNINNLYENWGN